ncbi:hypothetical protein ABH15_09385 [Methanoculleus taiwanensis]|uniref:DUF1616 domain-containing protein n=1 Tax=Methanoculleus taiwanensis TaxID=1550565 RepID=A0A498H1T0_9EURY|nr:hypothetical protein [Methanoculleus taiwanensis]RXE56315.1 hypothetical protein ABH15_09385 [Methanoculleus taiwanensis]
MPAFARGTLPYLVAGCALVGLLVIASAYVLSPGEVSLNVSFDPPAGYIEEDGRYVGVTVFTLTNENTIPVRKVECRYRYLDRESDRVVKSGIIEVGDLDPGQAKHYAVSCPMEEGGRYDIRLDLRYWRVLKIEV